MTTVASPLSRLVAVADLPPQGLDIVVEATSEEREALGRDFKLPAIHALTGTFHLSETRSGVRVSGHIEATINQICVVTLDPFDSNIREEVDVAFAAPGTPAGQDENDPDEIVNGMVDLGVLTAEFLALGIDPYPRKPGVDFTFEAADDRPESPFAALGKLKRNE